MSANELEQALGETKRAAKDLAVATARLTKHLLSKAETAARNPSGSATKAAKRVAKELDAASEEIERILKDL
jgi:hypothetical protein